MIATALLLLLSFSGDPRGEDQPPGLVLVPGGKTRIGSTVKEIEELILEREELCHALAGETPQFTRQVDDFYLMPTEVTNEQYAEYIRATGARPPRSWGAEALRAGQALFLEQQGKAKQEARAAGKPFQTQVFDAAAWWNEHWQEVHWKIPEHDLAHPVVFVSHADAEGYARWAGLRLMSEFEFQRAARGDTARRYPWGDQWDDRLYCQSLHTGKEVVAPVGSFPEGASGGIHDLAGNVWEWTSSPFEPFPGYEHLRVQSRGPGKRVIEGLAPFDPDQRVTVSGSFQMDRLGVRLTTRRETDRTQATNALGFRCAASLVPGLDAARWIIDRDLDSTVLPRGTELAPELALVRRRWTSTGGQVSVPGYAVIQGYQQALFCPVARLPASTSSELASFTAKKGPVFLGFIDVPCPLSAPVLDAGTYLVAWRGTKELHVSGGAADRDPAVSDELLLEQVPGFAPGEECFLFHDRAGRLVAALPAPPITADRRKPGRIRVEPAGDAPEGSREPSADVLRFTLALPIANSESRSLYFDLALRVAPGLLDPGWQ